MLSFITNESMERLSLVTVIFLRESRSPLGGGREFLTTVSYLQHLHSWRVDGVCRSEFWANPSHFLGGLLWNE